MNWAFSIIVSSENLFHLSLPSFLPGSSQDLNLESELRDLPLCDFSADISCLGLDLAEVFEKYPLLPGVILTEQGQFVGMLSRQRLLEYLIRPQGLELFLPRSLSVLYSYARTESLMLPGTMHILPAARLALRRSRELSQEPLIIEVKADTYYLLDVQELNLAAWQIRGIETQVRYERTQVQMLQSEKMASLGRLVSGVAHEILDPVGFIWGNLSHVSNYSDSLLELLTAYEDALTEVPVEIQELKEDLEFDYLQSDLPKAIQSITAGAERLKKLVTALQNFCHIDEVYPKPADINACLDGIILLLKSRLAGEIEVVKTYQDLPPVTCYIGQISQVFMSIITNAVDALVNQAVAQQFNQELKREASEYNSIPKPRIEIKTRIYTSEDASKKQGQKNWISISIADNGAGMPKEVRERILESFSIEKRTAKETSLAVSYAIVTANHGGQLKLRSRSVEEGYPPEETGTEFEILLPLV